MSSQTHAPLDFTSGSFERFQNSLRASCPPASWLWLLRDGIFGTLHHDPLTLKRVIRTKDALFILPGGWVLWLLAHKLLALVCKPPTHGIPANATHHLLFLSTRSNHIKRVMPLMRELSARTTCAGWAGQPEIPALVDEPLRDDIRLARNQWIRTLRFSDLVESASCVSELRRVYPGRLPWLQTGKVHVYVAIFLAWRRFWRDEFKNPPEFVLTTYEKDPMAKAMMYVAADLRVPQRVHWAHGLRHASLQATFATELWCLVKPDVAYYRERLPPDCVPVYKQSPEAIELIDKIGILEESDLLGLDPVHFLFLGNGFDAAYTAEQSRADLAVIRTAMRELGSRVKWRFRPHPGNIPRFKEDLEALGMSDVEISTNSLHDDLKWAHAAGSPFSSVLVDVKQTGRKIFWVLDQIRPLYGVDELIREGYGTHVDQATAASRIRAAFGL